jgi:hypothetical protein
MDARVARLTPAPEAFGDRHPESDSCRPRLGDKSLDMDCCPVPILPTAAVAHS